MTDNLRERRGLRPSDADERGGALTVKGTIGALTSGGEHDDHEKDLGLCDSLYVPVFGN